MSAPKVIQVLHPAPVVYTLKGRRVPQSTLVGVRTPVCLNEVAAAEAPHALAVTLGRRTHDYHAYQGQLWMRMGDVRRADFVKMLEGQGDGWENDATLTLFGTPIRGWDMKGAIGLPDALPPQLNEITTDLRGLAAQKVQAFAQDRILFAGEHILVRAHGPMGLASRNAAKSDYNEFMLEPFPAPGWHEAAWKLDKGSTIKALAEFPFRPDRLAGFHALLHRYADTYISKVRPLLPGAQEFPKGSFEDGDLVLLANSLPAVLLKKVAKELPEMPDEIAIPVQAAIHALAPDALRGQAALIDYEEAPGVLKRLQALADAAKLFDQRRTFMATAVWIDGYANPRIASRGARPVPADDAEALAVLKP